MTSELLAGSIVALYPDTAGSLRVLLERLFKLRRTPFVAHHTLPTVGTNREILCTYFEVIRVDELKKTDMYHYNLDHHSASKSAVQLHAEANATVTGCC